MNEDGGERSHEEHERRVEESLPRVRVFVPHKTDQQPAMEDTCLVSRHAHFRRPTTRCNGGHVSRQPPCSLPAPNDPLQRRTRVSSAAMLTSGAQRPAATEDTCLVSRHAHFLRHAHAARYRISHIIAFGFKTENKQ